MVKTDTGLGDIGDSVNILLAELPGELAKASQTGDYRLLSDYITTTAITSAHILLENNGKTLPSEIKRRLKGDSYLPSLTNFKATVVPRAQGKKLGLDMNIAITPTGDKYRTKDSIKSDAKKRVEYVISAGLFDFLASMIYTSGNIPDKSNGGFFDFSPNLTVKSNNPTYYRR